MAIDAKTGLFVSISARPSGNGVYFYNALFSRMDINAVYLSTPTNSLGDLCASLNLLGVRGAAIAAPFKTEVIAHLDELTEVARETSSVNCIRKASNGHWVGHNTDEVGLRQIFKRWKVKAPKKPSVVIYGSGGVVPSVISALRAVMPDCRIRLQARNSGRVTALCALYSIDDAPLNQSLKCDLFINATPLSEQETESIANMCNEAATVFDLNPIQEAYALETICKGKGKNLLRGFEFYLEQLIAQFEFFTGRELDREILDELVSSRNVIGCSK